MARAFKLPDLGEGIHEAEVQEILVSVGDKVEEGDEVLVVETDKASVDIPSPYTGSVKEIKVEPGDLVEVGDLMMTFGNGEIVRPKEGEGEAEADEEEPEAEAEADDLEEAAAKAEPDEAEKEAEEEENTAQQDHTPRENGRPVPASPATRRLARELDVDLHQVEGSGSGGRVTSEDVRTFAEEGPAPQKETAEKETTADKEAAEEEAERPEPAGEISLPAAAAALPDFSRWGEVERVPLRSVRCTIAQRMARSWSQIPHVTHHATADITRLDEVRQRYRETLDVDNLTLTAFVMKTAVAALKKHPRFNASFDPESGEIILKHYYHLGLAVDTDRGLIVPVIRDVDRKSIADLAEAIQQAARRTRDGEASLDEMQGGTFTITNVGILGGDHFTPIINYPQAAILGMAQASWQPTVIGQAGNRQIVPRFKLPLILAFDHRLVDGADAARFTNTIISMLEDPNQLMLQI